MNILYEITQNDAGKTLKDILKNKLYISNILRYNLIKFNKIEINNKCARLNEILKLNDKINIILDSKTDLKENVNNFYEKFSPYNFNLDILYEDEFLLIVNKPANMEVHPCISNYEKTLSNAVFNYLKNDGIYNIHIVTRLDKNTTGICVFAKHKYIQELFVRNKDKINLNKHYIAIVNGIIENDHDIIEKNIIRANDSIILRTTCENSCGDYAKTEYFVKLRNYDANYTVLDVLLHTGRTHQIRVHFSYLGHPLLGDDLYSSCKDTKAKISRQALHSHKITFNHPITLKHIEITANIPEDMQKLI